MLIKVLKYDFKWVYSLIFVFNVLAIIFAILSRLCLFIDNSLMFQIIHKIFSATSISMTISGIINVVTRSWIRFSRSVYKDESYLTHTLPVSKDVIYFSKILTSINVVNCMTAKRHNETDVKDAEFQTIREISFLLCKIVLTFAKQK